jgi:aminopeptidase YwaD
LRFPFPATLLLLCLTVVAAPPATFAQAVAPPAAAPAAPAAPAAFSGERALAHVGQLAQTIGSRPAGSPAAAAAGDYIAGQLAGYGYEVERQGFLFPQYEDRVSDLTAGDEPIEAAAMLYSGGGEVSGPLVLGGFGRAQDFPRRIDGAVALVARGDQITFQDKVTAATAAGAAAVVIYNSAPVGFRGSLQGASPSPVPVLAISGESGQRLRQRLQAGPLAARVVVDAGVTELPAENVVARRPETAPAARTVVVGAHFDSVPEGPGANDNASGSGLLLELARALAADPAAAPGLNVVFVAFGAEELGLLGSAHYVRGLTPEARDGTRAMLNFDMVGVGDALRVGGDAALIDLADGVARERGQTLGRLPASLGRASDHASFIAAGIPGIFFHVTDDPNYHSAGDTAVHVSPRRLQQMGEIGAALLRRLAAE